MAYLAQLGDPFVIYSLKTDTGLYERFRMATLLSHSANEVKFSTEEWIGELSGKTYWIAQKLPEGTQVARELLGLTISSEKEPPHIYKVKLGQSCPWSEPTTEAKEKGGAVQEKDDKK